MKENQNCKCPFEGIVKNLISRVSSLIEELQLKREYESKLLAVKDKGRKLVVKCEMFAQEVPADQDARHLAVFELEKAAIELANLYRWLDNYRAEKGGAR